MNPKISIITICYNCSATIVRIIKSVLSQVIESVEIMRKIEFDYISITIKDEVVAHGIRKHLQRSL